MTAATEATAVERLLWDEELLQRRIALPEPGHDDVCREKNIHTSRFIKSGQPWETRDGTRKGWKKVKEWGRNLP